MDMRSSVGSVGPTVGSKQAITPPDIAGTKEIINSIGKAAEPASREGGSRFDTLLQELKAAHSQEVAELRRRLTRQRGIRLSQDDAAGSRQNSIIVSSPDTAGSTLLSSYPSVKSQESTSSDTKKGSKEKALSPSLLSPCSQLSSASSNPGRLGARMNGSVLSMKSTPSGRSSQQSMSSAVSDRSVSFTWHGKTFGTAGRKPSCRASVTSARGRDSIESNTGNAGLMPALKKTSFAVTVHHESDVEVVALPNARLPSQVCADEVPLPDEGEPPYLTQTHNESELQALDVEHEEHMHRANRISAELAGKSVLDCNLDEDVLLSAFVKAALAHDQACLMGLEETREVKRYMPEQVWLGPGGQTGGPEHKQLYRANTSNNLELARAKTKNQLDDDDDVLTGGTWSRFLAVSPHSGRRMLWDVFTAIILIYDVVALPLILGFRPPQGTFQQTMDCIIATVWSFDIVASLLTGYYDKQKDQTILSLRAIALHYFKTWFVLDILLVAYDWVLMYMDAGSGGSSTDSGDNRSSAQLGRSLRTLRFVRTVRLLRILKMSRIMQEIHDRLPSEAASIVFRILKILCCLIVANHMVACMWYFIGSSQGQGSPSWVEENAMEGQSLVYQYAVSLHWSLSQCTPAGMEIYPAEGSLEERAFSVIVILVAMVGFSSFVSILTASMAELRKIASDETQQFWMLRRFLRDWSVSDTLSIRIQRYLEYAYAQNRRRVQFKDVHLLKLLSEPMHHELMHDMLSVHVRVHCLFEICGAKVFAGALATMSVARGDAVFSAGQAGVKMYFLCKGQLIYMLGEFDADHPERARWSDPERFVVDHVRAGEYASEAAIWTPWSHLGDLEAVAECTLVVVKADLFQKYAALNQPFLFAVKDYAVAFVRELNRIGITDLTDLLHQVIASQEILNEVGISTRYSEQEAPLSTSSDDLEGASSRQSSWPKLSIMPGSPRSTATSPRGTRRSVAVLNISAP